MFSRRCFSRFLVTSVLLLTWSPEVSTFGGGDVPKKKTNGDIQAQLESQGYAAIPFRRVRSGRLSVEVVIADKAIRLLIDTGSSSTYVSMKRTKAFGLTWDVADANPAARFSPSSCFVENIRFGSVNTGRLRVLDLDATEGGKYLLEINDSASEGIIGDDILESHQAIIDHPNRKLYLRQTTKEEPRLASGLAAKLPDRGRCQFSFSNLTGQDISLTVNGKIMAIAKDGVLKLDLARQFTWQVEGQPLVVESVARTIDQHEIVIRK